MMSIGKALCAILTVFVCSLTHAEEVLILEKHTDRLNNFLAWDLPDPESGFDSSDLAEIDNRLQHGLRAMEIHNSNIKFMEGYIAKTNNAALIATVVYAIKIPIDNLGGKLGGLGTAVLIDTAKLAQLLPTLQSLTTDLVTAQESAGLQGEKILIRSIMPYASATLDNVSNIHALTVVSTGLSQANKFTKQTMKSSEILNTRTTRSIYSLMRERKYVSRVLNHPTNCNSICRKNIRNGVTTEFKSNDARMSAMLVDEAKHLNVQLKYEELLDQMDQSVKKSLNAIGDSDSRVKDILIEAAEIAEFNELIGNFQLGLQLAGIAATSTEETPPISEDNRQYLTINYPEVKIPAIKKGIKKYRKKPNTEKKLPSPTLIIGPQG